MQPIQQNAPVTHFNNLFSWKNLAGAFTVAAISLTAGALKQSPVVLVATAIAGFAGFAIIQYMKSGDNNISKAPQSKPVPLPKEEDPISPQVGFRKSVGLPAPWANYNLRNYVHNQTPKSLPAGWEQHTATEDIFVWNRGTFGTRLDTLKKIPKGNSYFTYEGVIAVGIKGSYNPPDTDWG